MSRIQYDTFLEMRTYFQTELNALKEVIPLLIPVNDDDANMFQLLINMLDDLNNRMQSATSLNDVSDFIDLDALECDWSEQKEQIDALNKRAMEIIEKTADYWEADEEDVV